jgi:orotidine-5'-phosphate decarboxylase
MAEAKRLCVALDVSDGVKALSIAEKLKATGVSFKVGLELFTSTGPQVVADLVQRQLHVFLDLKFHDIPNTAAGAARSAARHGVAMFNVHASGGREMIAEAVRASREEAEKLQRTKPMVLAVTVLTSINDRILAEELLTRVVVKDAVRHFADLAKSAGADGVVASAQETALIRSACGPDFLIVTPGIRPSWAAMSGDQKRVTTPREAVDLGADYVVVGRPILQATDMVEACKRTLGEMGLQ